MIINDIDYGDEKVCAECGWSFFGPGRVCDECISDSTFKTKRDEDDPLDPPSRLHEPGELSGIRIRPVPDFDELYADSRE